VSWAGIEGIAIVRGVALAGPHPFMRGTCVPHRTGDGEDLCELWGYTRLQTGGVPQMSTARAELASD